MMYPLGVSNKQRDVHSLSLMVLLRAQQNIVAFLPPAQPQSYQNYSGKNEKSGGRRDTNLVRSRTVTTTDNNCFFLILARRARQRTNG